MRSKVLVFVAVLAALVNFGSSAQAVTTVVAPAATPIADYPELIEQWWIWGNAPRAQNPILDTTGQFCATGQTNPDVFLLANAFDGTVSRSCTVSSEDHLFVPLATVGWDKLASENIKLSRVLREIGCADQSQITLTVDGVVVTDRYLVQTGQFPVDLPEGNLYGIPAQPTEYSIARGWFALLSPLSPGEHTLRIESTSRRCSKAAIDVTYQLNVI